MGHKFPAKKKQLFASKKKNKFEIHTPKLGACHNLQTVDNFNMHNACKDELLENNESVSGMLHNSSAH